MKPTRKNLLLAAISLTLTAQSASAGSLYWDIDGATAGAGGTTPSGTWGTLGTTWSTDSTGATATSAYTTLNIDDLFFSAGTDATGSYTATLAANQAAKSLTFEEGATTITANTLTLTGGGITVLAGAGDPIISSNLTLTGGNTFNVGTGRTLTLNGTTFTRSARAALNVQGAGAVTSTMAGLAVNTNRIVGPWASFGTGTGTTYAAFNGTTLGGLTYAAAPTASQGTSVAASTGVVTGAGSLNYTLGAAGTLGTSAAINTLRWTGGAGSLATATSFTTLGIMNSGSGLLTFSGAVTAGAAGTEMVVNTASGDITFSSTFTGTINKTGSGTMTLSSVANSITNITVNEGTLVSNTSTADSLPSVIVNSGGTLRTAGGNTRFGNGAVFTVNAGGTWDLFGSTDQIGGLNGAGSVTNTGANANMNFNTTGSTAFSGVIASGSGTVGVIINGIGGTQAFTGLNTFTGVTDIRNGGLSINTIKNVGVASSIGAPALANATIRLGNGTGSPVLTYTGTGDDTDRVIDLFGTTGTATITQSGASGPLRFTSPFTATGAGSKTLTLSGSTAGTGEIAGAIVDNNTVGGFLTSLAKSGTGTWTLSGTNTYTGTTTGSGGELIATKTAALPGYNVSGNVIFNGGTIGAQVGGSGWTTGEVDTLLANATKTSGALGIDTTNGSLTQWTAFTTTNLGAALGLTKLGTNTLTLDQANTYAGLTTISAGTIKLAVDNGLSTASTSGLDIGSFAPTTATLDLNGFDQTISSLGFTTANAGGNLTVIGGANSKLTINTTSNTELGAGGAVTAARDVAVDMSGLGELDWNGAANAFRVGLRVGASNTANPGTFTTTLAEKNTITALTLAVGDVAASGNGGTSVLHLGQTNFLNANTVTLGGARSNTTMDFQSGLIAPTVKIRGTDGPTDDTARVTTWTVGRVNHTANSSWTNTADFSTGTLDARVITLNIGAATPAGTNRAGTVTSTFTMGAGTLDVTTLNVGQYTGLSTTTIGSSSTISGSGTFTLNDANGKVTAESVVLGDNTGLATGGIRSVSGTFNLSAGTLEAKTIDIGADTGNATSVTRNFNFTGGKVRNIAGFDLAIANVPINLTGSGTRVFEATAGQSITVASTSDISGSGQAFTKAGDGTMVIAGTKTYDGATLVSAGSLIINGNISTSVLTTVASDATLGGNGTVGAATISGILAPGNGIGTITAAGDVAWNANNSWVFELGTAAASLALADSGASTQDLLAITGGSSDFLQGTGSSFTFDFANGGELGYYKLVEWAGMTDFADGDFLATNLASGLTGTFTVDSGTSALYLNINAIPEPSAALLGALGAMLLLRRRR